ncbi:MAG: 30S ribosomal protein S16 [bacterium]|nr:30S ribosomal protein S16 [bacterium]
MLMIRLARGGKKNKPFFRVVISEKSKDLYGDSLEILGYVNPISPREIKLNAERIQYWLSKGAQCSPRVHNILVDEKIIDAPKIKKLFSEKKKVSEEKVEQKESAPTTNEMEAHVPAPEQGELKPADVTEVTT